MPPLKQIAASLRFVLCDFSKDYDFFIFSGNWAHFAARKHKPNIFNCRTTYYFYKRWGKPQTPQMRRRWQRLQRLKNV